MRPLPPVSLIPHAAAAVVILALIAASAFLWPESPSIVMGDAAETRPAFEPAIRVRISRAIESACLQSAGGILLSRGSEAEAYQDTVTLRPAGAARSRFDTNHVFLEPGEAVTLRAVAGTLHFDNLTVADEYTVIARVDGTGLDVIARLSLESYVAGVVGAELYAGWPRAAFEAQAVAARSYALHERSLARSAERLWDVDSTTAHQAFATASHDVARQAAEATRGQVLTYEGRILRAYYSSTCGGRCASASDHWPTGAGREFNLAPPLQAAARECPCSEAPLHRWTVELPRRELERRIRAWGTQNERSIRALGELRSVEIAERNSVGRPVSYRLSEASGREFVLSAESMRLAANFVQQPARSREPTDAAPSATLAGGEPDEEASTRAAPIRSSDLSFTFAGDEVRVDGRGFGHGVGLCQYGARAMAAAGSDWRSILMAYYPGATITQAYR